MPTTERRAHLTLFLLSASLMMVECLIVRQWNVALGWDVQFLVLPLVMLGMAAGAGSAFLATKARAQPDGLNTRLRHLTVGYAVSAPLAFVLLPWAMHGSTAIQALAFGGTFLGALIFFGAWGYQSSVLFALHPQRTLPLYASSLAGSIGGVTLALSVTDGWGAHVGVGWSVAVAGLVPFVWAAYEGGPRRRALLVLWAGLCLAAALALPALVVLHAREAPPDWYGSHSFGQVELYPSSSVGRAMRLPSRNLEDPSEGGKVRSWDVLTDGRAGARSYAIRYESLADVRFLEHDLSFLPFELGNRRRALILGSGGGSEVIQALLGSWQEIDAVEINPLMPEAALAVGAGSFYSAPHVHFHVSEGRRFLQAEPHNYDLIVLPNVRAFGALGAAGGPFLQNYLLTAEAMALYLSRLEEGGMLVIRNTSVSWTWCFSTLLEAVRRSGSPARWAAVGTAPETVLSTPGGRQPTTLLVVKDGAFTAEQQALIAAFSEEEGSVLRPVDLTTPAPGEAAPFSSDDQPFSLQLVLSDHVVPWSAPPSWSPQQPFLRTFRGLTTLLSLELGAALLIVVAGWAVARRKVPRDGRRPWLVTSGYFAALGCGFTAVELLLIEKVFITLGNPTLAFGVGVTALLAGALAGVALVGRRPRWAGRLGLIAAASPVAILGSRLALALVADHASLSVAADVALAGAALVPTGVLIGVLFPVGLSRMGGEQTGLGGWMPWFFAVNGAASVFGGIATKLLSVLSGFNAVLLLALASYLIAAVLAHRLAASLPASGAAR